MRASIAIFMAFAALSCVVADDIDCSKVTDDELKKVIDECEASGECEFECLDALEDLFEDNDKFTMDCTDVTDEYLINDELKECMKVLKPKIEGMGSDVMKKCDYTQLNEAV